MPGDYLLVKSQTNEKKGPPGFNDNGLEFPRNALHFTRKYNRIVL